MTSEDEHVMDIDGNDVQKSGNEEVATDKGKPEKIQQQRDYLKEARSAQSTFFVLNSVEDARKHLQTLRDFRENDLPKINELARQYGPKMAKIIRLDKFLRANSRSPTCALLTIEEKQELKAIRLELETAATVKSEEQMTLEKRLNPHIPKPPSSSKKDRFYGRFKSSR